MVKLVAKEITMDKRNMKSARQNGRKRLGQGKLPANSSVKTPVSDKKSRDVKRLAAEQIRGLSAHDIGKENYVKVVPPKPPRSKKTLQQLYWSTKTEMLSIIEEDLKLKLEIKAMKEQFLNMLWEFEELQSQGQQESGKNLEQFYHDHVREAVNNNDKQTTNRESLENQEHQTTGFRSTDITNSTKTSYGSPAAPNQTTASGSLSNLGDIYINELSKEDFPAKPTRSSKKARRLRTVRETTCDTSSDSSYNQPYPNNKPALHPSLKKMPYHRSIDSSLADMSDITKASDQSSRWYSSTNEINEDDLDRAEQPQQSTPTNKAENKKSDHHDNDGDSDNDEIPAWILREMGVLRVQGSEYQTPGDKGQSTSALSSLDDSTPIVIPKARRHLFAGVIDYRDDSGITGSNSDHTASPSTLREYTINPTPRHRHRLSFPATLPNPTPHGGSKRRMSDVADLVHYGVQDSLGCSYLPSRQDFNITGENLDDPVAIVTNTDSPDTGAVSLVTRPPSRAHDIDTKDVLEYESKDFSYAYSPTVSFMGMSQKYSIMSSYKESDGVGSLSCTANVSEDILGERPEMIGKEASILYPNTRSDMGSLTDSELIPDVSYDTNDPAGSVCDQDDEKCWQPYELMARPPCIGRESTPGSANNSEYSFSATEPTNVPTEHSHAPQNKSEDHIILKSRTKAMENSHGDESGATDTNTNHNTNTNRNTNTNTNRNKATPRILDDSIKRASSDSETLNKDYEAFKKKIFDTKKPTFGVFDYGDIPEDEKETEKPHIKAEEKTEMQVIDIDKYIHEKGDKKKTFFKKLKGFGKHFRVNSRRKSYDPSELKYNK